MIVPAGARGLIVGVVTGTNEAGIPVVDPISVPIAEGRLPDGFRLPATRLGSRP